MGHSNGCRDFSLYHFLKFALLFSMLTFYSPSLPANAYVIPIHTCLCFVPLKYISSEIKVFTGKKIYTILSQRFELKIVKSIFILITP